LAGQPAVMLVAVRLERAWLLALALVVVRLAQASPLVVVSLLAVAWPLVEAVSPLVVLPLALLLAVVA
jgi:hypothetical protein